MRVLLVALSMLVFLGGCVTTAPKSAKPKKKVKYFRIDGEKLENGTRAYTPKDFRELMLRNTSTQRTVSGSPGRHAQDFIIEFNLMNTLKTRNNSVVYRSRKFDDSRIEYEDSNFRIRDIAYNSQRDQYILTGTHRYIPYPRREESRPFALVFNAANKKLHKFYQSWNNYSVHLEHKHGNAAIVYKNNRHILLDFLHEKAVKLDQTTYTAPRSTDFLKSSYKGSYVALKLSGAKENTLRIALFDSKTGDHIKYFNYKNADSTNKIDFDFSRDESYFIIKGPGKPFQIYDIAKKKIVESFGEAKSWANGMQNIVTVDNLVLASMSGTSGKELAYIYDLQKRAVVCELDALFSGRDQYWKGDNSLHVMRNWNWHERYSIKENACLKVDKKYIEIEQSPAMKKRFMPKLTFIKDDAYYSFDAGKITKYVDFKQTDIDPEKVSILKSLKNTKRLLSAGFDKKAFAELEKLLYDNTDYFKEYYNTVTDTLFTEKNIKYIQEAYFNALAFKTYIRQGNTSNNPQFERAARNYAWFAAVHGYEEVLPSFIDAYSQAVGSDPSALQRDMLAIYKAIYLLETNKDDAAYELLFAANPIDKKAKEHVVKMSAFDFGFFKDRKKTAVALGMETSDFNNSLGEFVLEKYVPYFYDLNGNKLKHRAQRKP